MSDEELVKRLRGMDGDSMSIKTLDEAADLIEALTAKLAKAMSRAKRVTSFEDTTEELAECGCARCKAHLKLRALLAEIEGEKT
jgi:hypothetical protein